MALKTITELAEGYALAETGHRRQRRRSDNLLHAHAGLAICVVTTLLMRRGMRFPWPLAIVTIFALLNEAVDYLTPRTGDFSVFDVLNTAFWPMVLFLLARRGGGISAKL